MAYCRNCGAEVKQNEPACPQCGVSTRFQQSAPSRNTGGTVDDGNFLWGLLGFCVPIAGLVIYLIWKDEKPNNARAAGKGALFYVGFVVILYIFILLFAGIAGAM